LAIGSVLPFAISRWSIRIHMHNTQPKPPKLPARRAGFGRCTTLLYEHQESLEDEDLAEYATALGLDARRLITEVLAGEHLARVREDFRSGARAGVNGTPTLFINGIRYSGAPQADALLAALTTRATSRANTAFSK